MFCLETLLAVPVEAILSHRAPAGPGGELEFLTAWRGQTWEPHPGTRGVGSARPPGFSRALTHLPFSDLTTAPLQPPTPGDRIFLCS